MMSASAEAERGESGSTIRPRKPGGPGFTGSWRTPIFGCWRIPAPPVLAAGGFGGGGPVLGALYGLVRQEYVPTDIDEGSLRSMSPLPKARAWRP